RVEVEPQVGGPARPGEVPRRAGPFQVGAEVVAVLERGQVGFAVRLGALIARGVSQEGAASVDQPAPPLQGPHDAVAVGRGSHDVFPSIVVVPFVEDGAAVGGISAFDSAVDSITLRSLPSTGSPSLNSLVSGAKASGFSIPAKTNELTRLK